MRSPALWPLLLVAGVGQAARVAHDDGARQPGGAAMVSRLGAQDVLVFGALESLGVCALLGNVTLLVIIFRHRYLDKGSFVLMANLAVADILHAVVTSTYFYPPIVLKRNHMPHLACRIWIAFDWTAWGITISHMSAICIDRLIAILLFGKYPRIMAPSRVKMFSTLCWLGFGAVTSTIFAFDLCCVIKPQGSADFYSFDYEYPDNATSVFNVYPAIFTPLEVTAIGVLAVCTPVTLVNLWRRHQRKAAMRRASCMLLDVSDAMTRKGDGAPTPANRQLDDARRSQRAAAKAIARQQQRIFFQIISVTLFFFCYMSAYYICFYVIGASNKWVVLFNSFLYSTTHMINPLVYFTVNAEMRAQLRLLLPRCCLRQRAAFGGSGSKPGGRSPRMAPSSDSAPSTAPMNLSAPAESSPLLSVGAAPEYRRRAASPAPSDATFASEMNHFHDGDISAQGFHIGHMTFASDDDDLVYL